jgi:hypothetical protein
MISVEQAATILRLYHADPCGRGLAWQRRRAGLASLGWLGRRRVPRGG